MQQPLISFIVTAYNIPPEMLHDCLGSILALSLSRQEREIILVDDGSDLSPIDGLSDMADDIIYIRQHNQGLSMARNTGLKMAGGRYIQFVDGDDMLIRAPYEHCLDIARYHNPDVVTFNSTSATVAETPFTYDGPKTGSNYMRDNNIRAAAWGYIFERIMIGKLRFTPGILHEDEEFTPQLLLRSERLYSTDAQAYFYRHREGSIVNTPDSKHTDKRLADMENIIYRLHSLVVPEADQPAINRRVAQLTMDYLYNVIKLTHSRARLNGAVERLERNGLFPLPEKDYTKKYKIFRKLVNNRHTRLLLFLALKR